MTTVLTSPVLPGTTATAEATVTVVLPAYNEAARVARTIESIGTYAADHPHLRHVVLADDGSIDETISVAVSTAAAAGLPLIVRRFPHRGKASTVREAMLDAAVWADTDLLMMLDADDEVTVSQLANVSWEPDPRTVYIARRVAATAGTPRPTPFRRLMSFGMRTATRTLLGINFQDTQCGFKLFPRRYAVDLFSQQRSAGWTFDAELLLIAHRISGFPVVEVPVIWSPRGGSKVGATAAVTSAASLVATWWHRARGRYHPIEDLSRPPAAVSLPASRDLPSGWGAERAGRLPPEG